MCSNDAGPLTLTGLLTDPLTRLVMRSDGVSERDFSELMQRVQGCLIARHANAPAGEFTAREISRV